MSHSAYKASTAIIAAAAAALCLAGCGRKAGLDPPPASTITDERPVGPQTAAPPEPPPDQQPVEITQLPRAGTPLLDWLIE